MPTGPRTRRGSPTSARIRLGRRRSRSAPNRPPSISPSDPHQAKPGLLCISHSFAPETTPTAIRASKLLQRLSAQWQVIVLSEAEPAGHEDVRVEAVRGRGPRRLLAALRRLRLSKLQELFVWPDESIFWVIPAILAGRRIVREIAPSAIVVFMMPYSSGLVGVALSRLTGLPLVLNLDDSPTCTDMHPLFATRLHYRLAKALEDFYVKRADAIVYVSQTNLDAVRSRQPADAGQKFHLVRYGADRAAQQPQPAHGERFEIVYVGAMSGWWELIGRGCQASRLRRVYGAWTRLGRYERTILDQRTASPAIIGRALIDAVGEHGDWQGRVGLAIYDNAYPASVVSSALQSAGVERVVSVRDPVAHDEVAGILRRADLLFMTLPKRTDDSRGGRISAKTYEYLMTDRPILAALPRGENWDYLEGKPGVWLVEPDDHQRMQQIVVELAAVKFAGRPAAFNREQLRHELSYDARADEFATVIRAAIARRSKR